VEDGLDVGDFLTHPLRVLRDTRPGVFLGEIKRVEECVDALACLLVWDVAEPSDVLELLVGGRLLVQRWFLGKIADVGTKGVTVSDVRTGDSRRSAGRLREPREQPHGGRLPGSVRTEKAVDRSFGDGEIEGVDGGRSFVAFRQSAGFNCVCHL
jgi:hypothetical protein